jgi:hypothetical protein
MESPSHRLASKIIERLVREKLLTPQQAKSLQNKVAEGKMRSEDWQLAVDICAAEEGRP